MNEITTQMQQLFRRTDDSSGRGRAQPMLLLRSHVVICCDRSFRLSSSQDTNHRERSSALSDTSHHLCHAPLSTRRRGIGEASGNVYMSQAG